MSTPPRPGAPGRRAALPRWRSVVVLLALAAAGAAHAQLSDIERRIVEAVKQRSAPALELLERSARINSGTLNPQGVREVGELLRAELDALGFATRWAEMPPEMNRAGHLIGTRAGSQGKRLLLLGHLDTVFDKASPVTAWERRGDRVRGQGVSDMKGGNVVLVEALRALQAVGALDGTRLSVMFTGDEERVGRPLERARADLVDLAKASDAALSFEAASRLGGEDFASITRRSAGGWTLKVRGRPGHSAGVFSPISGFGAIYEAARILNAFREQLVEPGVTFNPGMILGGSQTRYDANTASGTAAGRNNIIAAEVEAYGDLRVLTPDQGERVRQRMREIVGASLAGTRATIEFSETYPPMPASEGSQRLLEAYSKASEDAGLGPIVAASPSMRGAGDVQFAAPFIPGIDGLGARGSGAHTDNEDLEIASIERGAIRAAILIYRLTRP